MKFKIIILTILIPVLSYCQILSERDFERLRKNMVAFQIAARGIQNTNVLKTMLKVPRHEFVPEALRPHAYEDRPLPIGEGQTISQPYIVALMTELLEVKKTDKILEIGTGSGYQAAILAELTPYVWTIEIIPVLAERAKKVLYRLNYTNVKVKIGDGYLGWKEFAPFDSIIVTCAPERIPPPLIEQLKEGGRMVIPVGKAGAVQELVVVYKQKGGRIFKKPIIPVRFVPMIREKESK